MIAYNPSIPTVALVGRSNVGKSTLFNRLTDSHRALVSALAGTTRDRKLGLINWQGKALQILDTGGLEFSPDQPFSEDIQAQTNAAIGEADLLVMVIDAKEGVLQQERPLIQHLRTTGKPLMLVANKAEGQTRYFLSDKDVYQLGLGTPLLVSAVNGSGLGDLLDELMVRVADLGKPAPDYVEPVQAPHILFIGEPNVGKSSIVNAILKEDRLITSDVSHTTREPNDLRITVNERDYILVDTAGVRRKTKVEAGMEKAGVRSSLHQLNRADIAVLVLDATKEIDHQEKKLAGLVHEAGVGVIIVINKWDLVEEKGVHTLEEFERYVYGHLPFLTYAPLLTVSAKHGQRVSKLFPLFDTIMAERDREISENALSVFLKRVINEHRPARGKGVAHPTIFHIKQVGRKPPTFELLVKGSRTDVLHASYMRFLENRLREKFGFTGTSIRIYAIPSK